MPSPVKVLAEANNLPVFQPASLRPQENQQLVSSLNADVMVVVAYGLILPKAVLDMPPLAVLTSTVLCRAGAERRLYSAHSGRVMPKPV